MSRAAAETLLTMHLLFGQLLLVQEMALMHLLTQRLGWLMHLVRLLNHLLLLHLMVLLLKVLAPFHLHGLGIVHAMRWSMHGVLGQPHVFALLHLLPSLLFLVTHMLQLLLFLTKLFLVQRLFLLLPLTQGLFTLLQGLLHLLGRRSHGRQMGRRIVRQRWLGWWSYWAGWRRTGTTVGSDRSKRF